MKNDNENDNHLYLHFYSGIVVSLYLLIIKEEKKWLKYSNRRKYLLI